MKYESIIKPPTSKQLKSGRVTLLPKESVGEHITSAREEVIIVLEGKVTLILPDGSHILQTSNIYYVPPETKHDVKNESDASATYVYVVCLFE